MIKSKIKSRTQAHSLQSSPRSNLPHHNYQHHLRSQVGPEQMRPEQFIQQPFGKALTSVNRTNYLEDVRGKKKQSKQKEEDLDMMEVQVRIDKDRKNLEKKLQVDRHSEQGRYHSLVHIKNKAKQMQERAEREEKTLKATKQQDIADKA